MGQKQIVRYGDFIGEEIPGETRILRHHDYYDKELSKEFIPGIDTLWKAFENTKNKYPIKEFLGTQPKINDQEYGDYRWKSFSEIFELSVNFSNGIINLGLCPNVKSNDGKDFRFFGIYSKNREEWVISDLACHYNGITVVTIYDSLGDGSIEFIIDDCLLTSLGLESKNIPKINILKKNKKAKSLQNLILFDVEDEKSIKEAISLGFNVYLFPDIVKNGLAKKNEPNPAKPETIATLCYTSGTTGTPKGAMISHRAIIAALSALENHEAKYCIEDVHLSYLPLSHVYERMILAAAVSTGIRFGFSTGNPLNLIKDAQKLKPTIFAGVPRVYQRIYDVIKGKINESSYVAKLLINRTINVKLYNYRNNGLLTHPIYDTLVCRKFKEALGGRVRLMLTGSAPISKNTVDFLKVLFCVPILEGYGQTEGCCGATLCSLYDFDGGNVGGVISGAEIKLKDVPELGYFSTDETDGKSTPRGEILVRGPCLFSGYYNNPEKTEEALDKDGWLHSGDIGMILPNKAIRLIDRLKNILKLSQGEYIAPEKIENLLCNSKYVEQIYVEGISTENFLISIIVPKKSAVKDFLVSIGIQIDESSIIEHYNNAKLKEDVLKDLEKLGKEVGLKGFEMIKKVHLTETNFTIENDLLTPTLKLKRHEARKKFKKEIESLYQN